MFNIKNLKKKRRGGGQITKNSNKRIYRKRTIKSNKEKIDLSKFVQKATITEQKEYVPKNIFDDFNINPILKTNIKKKGFKNPSPIQDKAIPEGLAGKDIIGIANTGTGKTIAFAIPVVNKLIADNKSNVIIMTPTRELAQQILEEIKYLAKGSNLYHALLIGGSPIWAQLRDLKRNPRIIIGTPGRIQDHISRKSLEISRFNIIVLDEVDRMLDMGFIEDMRIILKKLNIKKQSFFFSATMEKKVQALIGEFSNNPTLISVKTSASSQNVEQNIIKYKQKDKKIEILSDLLVKNKNKKMLIFDATKKGVEQLSKDLNKKGFKTDSIHGDKNQRQRERALLKFKKNEINILVATDVAARGIDVPDIAYVVNYSVPQTHDDYIHRIGRAGRAGKMGNAITFIK